VHEAIAGEKFGGVGPGLTAKAALDVGLKVGFGAVPSALVDVLKSGGLHFDDVKTTQDLLKHDAVVGVKAFYKDDKLINVGHLRTLPFDDRRQLRQGHRARPDGWPNRDLNVGAIAALSPNLSPMAEHLGVDLATVKKMLQSWGPGKCEPS